MHGKSGLRTLRSSLGVTYWLFLLRQTLIFGISFEADDHIYDRMWQGFWDFVFVLPKVLGTWPSARLATGMSALMGGGKPRRVGSEQPRQLTCQERSKDAI